MASKKPTAEQGQLLLQLYDLRREAKLRQARDWFFANYYPETVEEANRIAPMGSEQNTYVRMVLGYWDQACALLHHGLLHEELFFETSGEFYGVYEQIRPVLQPMRQQFSAPFFFEALEKAALRYEKWISKRAPKWLEAMRGFRKQMRAGKSQAKSA